MPDALRRSPFVWVTWLTGLLSGDKQCQYALWYRAQHQYEKRPDDHQADLSKWKADHARMVQSRADTLRQRGWHVYTESENKFMVYGALATLLAVPDIVAVRTGEPDLLRGIALDGEIPVDSPEAEQGQPVAVVEDCKTGKRKDSDYWQVVIYMMFLPVLKGQMKERLLGARPSGTVVYNDGDVVIPVSHANQTARESAAKLMRMAAGTEPPRPTPSSGECGWCDVANCTFRVAREDVATAEATDF